MKKFDKNYITKNSFWPENNRGSYHCFNENGKSEGVAIMKIFTIKTIFICKNGNSHGVDMTFNY